MSQISRLYADVLDVYFGFLAACSPDGLNAAPDFGEAFGAEVWKASPDAARFWEIVDNANTAMLVAFSGAARELRGRVAEFEEPGTLGLYGSGTGQLQFRMRGETTQVLRADELAPVVLALVEQWTAREVGLVKKTIATTQRMALEQLHRAELLPEAWVALAERPLDLARAMYESVQLPAEADIEAIAEDDRPESAAVLDAVVPYAFFLGRQFLGDGLREDVPTDDRLRRARLIVAAMWQGEISDLPELPNDDLLLTRLAGRFIVWKSLTDQLMLFDAFAGARWPETIWAARQELNEAVRKRFAELGVLIPGAAADGYGATDAHC